MLPAERQHTAAAYERILLGTHRVNWYRDLARSSSRDGQIPAPNELQTARAVSKGGFHGDEGMWRVEGGWRVRGVPLLKLDGGHRYRACLGDSPRLHAGDHGNPVFYRHLVQDRAAGVVVQSALSSSPRVWQQVVDQGTEEEERREKNRGEGFRHVKVREGCLGSWKWRLHPLPWGVMPQRAVPVAPVWRRAQPHA